MNFCRQWESSESDFSEPEESNDLGAGVGPEICAMDTVDSVNKRQATRVFKKSSLNGKITVYLGKRDFVDHITHVDPIGKYILRASLLLYIIQRLVKQKILLPNFRRSRPDRSRVHKGAKGVRPCPGRVQVRQGGPGRARADLSQGSLPGRGANLSRGAGIPAAPGTDAVTGETHEEARK